MSERPDRKDPRFRPFRIAALTVYLAVVLAFSFNVIASVLRSALAMSPARLPEAEAALTVGECADGVERLFGELEDLRKNWGDQAQVRHVDEEWMELRVKWLEKFRKLESECAIRSKSRERIRSLFVRLERIQDLYTTQAVQFAGELGGAIDGLHEAARQARQP